MITDVTNPLIYKNGMIKFALVGAHLLKGYHFVLRVLDMDRVLSLLLTAG